MGLAEKLQQPPGRGGRGAGTGDAGKTLHRGVPGNDRETGVGNNYRVVEAVDDARPKVIHVLDEYSSSGAHPQRLRSGTRLATV